jgi:hypothetical protein
MGRNQAESAGSTAALCQCRPEDVRSVWSVAEFKCTRAAEQHATESGPGTETWAVEITVV